MEVHELIEKLKEFPQNMKVYIPDDEASLLEAMVVFICKDEWGKTEIVNGEEVRVHYEEDVVYISSCYDQC